MLRAIELQDFKAFGIRQRIEIAPITLIFGENSAGKSSILQALSLLKQSRQFGKEDSILLPRVEHGVVDLGSFEELVHGHDLKKPVVIRIDFSDPRDNKQSYGFELQFLRPPARTGVQLTAFRVFRGMGVPKLVAEFSPSKRVPSRKRQKLPGAKKADSRFAKCTWVTDDRSFWNPLISRFFDIRDTYRSVDKMRLQQAERDRLKSELGVAERSLQNTVVACQRIEEEIARLTARWYELAEFQERIAITQDATVKGRQDDHIALLQNKKRIDSEIAKQSQATELAQAKLFQARESLEAMKRQHLHGDNTVGNEGLARIQEVALLIAQYEGAYSKSVTELDLLKATRMQADQVHALVEPDSMSEGEKDNAFQITKASVGSERESLETRLAIRQEELHATRVRLDELQSILAALETSYQRISLTDGFSRRQIPPTNTIRK